MRLGDLLCDIRETSQRLEHRKDVLDDNLMAGLTLRTLMRSDVVLYFESLIQGAAPCGYLSIIYIIMMFGYVVNTRNPVSHASVLAFSQQALGIVDNVAKGEDVFWSDNTVLGFKKTISRLLKDKFRFRNECGISFGIYQTPPTRSELVASLNSSKSDATLYIFLDKPENMEGHVDSRISFCDALYISRDKAVYLMYVSSTDGADH